MLTFRPVVDLAANQIPSHLCAYGVFEEDRLLGLCTFEMKGYEVDLLDLTISEQNPAAAEGLARSVLHYAGNRGAYLARFQGEHWSAVAAGLKVEKQPYGFAGEIPEILRGGCDNL